MIVPGVVGVGAVIDCEGCGVAACESGSTLITVLSVAGSGLIAGAWEGAAKGWI